MLDQSVIDEIRAHWRDFFPADQHDGIICPLCNSGSGEHGTGISEVPEQPGLLKCFACGWSGDVIQLFAEVNHLDFRADFPKIVRQMSDQLGLRFDDDEPVKLKPASDDCLEHTDYFKRRGISIDTARHFRISFVKDYKHSAKFKPMPAVIIPLEPSDSFIARDTRKNPKLKTLNRGKTHLFNPAALSEFETVFVVEGVIDALSLYEVGFTNVVSVNGVANTRILKDALESANPKPKRLIFALDNDDAGIAATPKFFKLAARMNIIAIDAHNISGDKKDANDLLCADRELLRANCQAVLEQAMQFELPSKRILMRSTKDSFPDCPYEFEIPPGWGIDNDGVFKQGVFDEKFVEASLTPVFPVRRLFNHFYKITRYVLAFFDGTRWNETTVDAEFIADPSKTVRLADHGIQTFAGAVKFLVVFFNKFIKLNFERIPFQTEYIQTGWHNDFQDFVLPHFRDYYAPTLEDMYGVGGQSDMWLGTAKLLRKELTCPIVRIMIDLSFAAPILPIIGMRTFTAYLWGNSLSGKTAAQKFAISAWGNPERMKATFRSTANGIEGAAAKSNNIPLMIDERQAAEANLDLNKLSYSLSNEQDKGRMDRTGNLRPKKTWRMTVLATGEDIMVDRSAALGSHNRVLQIHLGLDESLFGTSPNSNWKFAPSKIHTFAEENYGHAGRMWIEKLLPYRQMNFANVKETYASFETAIFKNWRDRYTSEHLRYVAVIATVDYLLAKELFGAPEEKNYETRAETMEKVVEYLIGKLPYATSLMDSTRAWEWLMEFISAGKRHFTGNHLRDERDLKDQVYGTIRVSGGEIKKILLYPDRLRAEMKKAGFPVEKCLADFRSRGWIASDKDGINPKERAHDGTKPTNLRMIVIPKEYANLIKIDDEIDDDDDD